MSKDPSSGGLLSKVVKFVRHPATSWGDLDTVASERDQYSKQALKEMIERKRRNDFVRKREFDMLRRLRAKTDKPDAGQRGRPSFFQSSFNSKPDDRAGTLKKIDEIEAQMSMQWWKTKQRDSAGHTVQPTRSAPPTQPPQDAISTTLAYGTTVPVGDTRLNATTQAMDASGATLPMTAPPLATGGVGAGPAPVGGSPLGQAAAPAAKAARRPAPGPTEPGALPSYFGSGADAGPTQPPGGADSDEADDFESSQFSASKFYALDVAELAMDPEIEEAAIRFASGDQAATEQGLLEVLQRKGAGGTTEEWLALLDLYRATGQVDKFENRALDFANRFSRSAPQWVSIPDEVASRVAKSAVVAEQSRAHWTAEPEMDGHMITMMTRMLERVPPPWVLDWSALQTIQPTALVRLARLFAGWANAALELRFVGSAQLLQVLQRMTPSGQRDAEQVAWELRLAVLRVMNLPDEFELVALDFCVTYEISPPAWEAPCCTYRDLSGEALGIATRLDDLARGQAAAGPEFIQSARAELDLQGTVSIDFRNQPLGELVGELVGDPTSVLEELDRLMAGTSDRVVSCRHLIRVDFAAAGSILNWASAHRAQGRRVRFVGVHRLISAFFHVIGITEQADVLTRED